MLNKFVVLLLASDVFPVIKYAELLPFYCKSVICIAIIFPYCCIFMIVYMFISIKVLNPQHHSKSRIYMIKLDISNSF